MAKKRSAKDIKKLNDDFSYISAADGKTYTMTIKERLFCEYYLEFKGDGVDAIKEAGYDVKNNIVAAAMSYENLRKPHLMAYVNALLEEYGFNDDHVEKQHMFLLQQHADLKTKAKAIEMYYRLRGKFPKESPDINLHLSLKDLAQQRERAE
jgi:hypothetical protein